MAKARGSGRKRGGWMRVRKTREVTPDGAYAYSWAYQAKIADALAEARDAERTAEANKAAVVAAKIARSKKAEAEAAAEAQRQAKLAARPCLRCQAVLPPEDFERSGRAYNGRMGCCRPCAQLIRDRKAAPVGRRAQEKPKPAAKECRRCLRVFTPPHHNVVYCSESCRETCQTARHAAQHRAAYQEQWEQRRARAKAWRNANRDKARAHRRAAYHAHAEAEKAAHAVWVARNRARVNASQREYARRTAAIAEAKAAFWEAGFFLLVRARSGFWRGDAPGRRIGQTETIMARFERVLEEWTILPPVLATPEAQRFVTRMILASRRAARRYVTMKCRKKTKYEKESEIG